MTVSIKDIGRLAGVSHSTVSRALRNSPLIPAETARRIQKIAKEAGYSASAVARSLVTRKTHAIGVVVTSIADPFNGEVVAGIEEAANRHGYSVILASSQADPEREIAVVRSFQERRLDGILVASSRVGALYMPLLSELKIPVVLINNQHPK
ncbi:MAG: LacI family DNA-binding transcriptional regulator, partial [Bryobacteraceae bacterium]